MKINFIRLLVLTIIIVSCSQTNNENFRPVTFYQYQLWVTDLDKIDLKDSTTLYLDIIKSNQVTDYSLKYFPNSDSLTMLSYSIKGDSLFFQGTYCSIADTIDFAYNGQSITLYRSFYDTPYSSDEEAFLFWSPRYGLIGEYNIYMGPIWLFDNQDIPNFTRDILYNYIVDKERGKEID